MGKQLSPPPFRHNPYLFLFGKAGGGGAAGTLFALGRTATPAGGWPAVLKCTAAAEAGLLLTVRGTNRVTAALRMAGWREGRKK